MNQSRKPRKWVPTIVLAAGCCMVLAVLVTARLHRVSPVTPGSASEEWHEFQGTWTAAGSRNVLELGQDRRATISTFSGSLVLAGKAKPAVGFRSDAIIFNDSATGLVGRAVWTDERGERVFSELRGTGTATNNKILGKFVGGTGRYSGATGTYEFSWRFLIEGEDGVVQGQSIGLTGRVRAGSDQVASLRGAPQS